MSCVFTALTPASAIQMWGKPTGAYSVELDGKAQSWNKPVGEPNRGLVFFASSLSDEPHRLVFRNFEHRENDQADWGESPSIILLENVARSEVMLIKDFDSVVFMTADKGPRVAGAFKSVFIEGGNGTVVPQPPVAKGNSAVGGVNGMGSGSMALLAVTGVWLARKFL